MRRSKKKFLKPNVVILDKKELERLASLPPLTFEQICEMFENTPRLTYWDSFIGLD